MKIRISVNNMDEATKTQTQSIEVLQTETQRPAADSGPTSYPSLQGVRDALF